MNDAEKGQGGIPRIHSYGEINSDHKVEANNNIKNIY